MKIVHFAANGARTFRCAARGLYSEESEGVSSLRREMLSHTRTKFDDVQNLRHDRMMVGRDTRVSFKKITKDNG